MRRKLTALATFVIMLATMSIVIGVMDGCAGKRAREVQLAPAILLATTGFEADTRAGLAVASIEEVPALTVAVDQFFDAIASRDRERIAFEAMPNWVLIKKLALSGIEWKLENGEIGPTVAGSLRERVENYEEGLVALASRL